MGGVYSCTEMNSGMLVELSLCQFKRDCLKFRRVNCNAYGDHEVNNTHTYDKWIKNTD